MKSQNSLRTSHRRFSKKVNVQRHRPQGAASAHAEEKSSKVPRSVPFSIEMALAGLKNNETRVTTEVKSLTGKAGSETKVVYPAELVAAFRSMFPSTRHYDFQLHSTFTVTTNAGGAALDVSPISPTATTYGEWSALSLLFDEVKGLSSSVQYVSILNAGGTGGAITSAPLVLAFDEQNINTAPTSYTQVYRLASSVCFQSQNGDAGSGTHKQRHRFAPRPYANTATPAIQSPPSGMIGAWMLANGAVFPVSTNVALFNQTVVARFKCRA